MPADTASDGATLSARMAIRAATAVAHERLHHIPAFARLADGQLDRNGYVNLLMRLLGLHEPMEAAIARGLSDISFGVPVERLRRVPLLRADLAALGVRDGEIAVAPRFKSVPAWNTPAQAMGALYVLEGATLGGRQLARQLDHILPLGGSGGRSFLLAGTASDRPSWAAFCAALERCGADTQRRASIIDAADRAFECFARWFDAGANSG